MLNNTELTDAAAAVILFEYGTAELDQIEDYLIDTRDTLENFRDNCHEWQVKERVRNGVTYWAGTIQRVKGDPRMMFVFIPDPDGWNYVLLI